MFICCNIAGCGVWSFISTESSRSVFGTINLVNKSDCIILVILQVIARQYSDQSKSPIICLLWIECSYLTASALSGNMLLKHYPYPEAGLLSVH